MVRCMIVQHYIVPIDSRENIPLFQIAGFRVAETDLSCVRSWFHFKPRGNCCVFT